MPEINFTPLKLETVVVLRGRAVIGTIRRYKPHGCQVRIPGLLTPSSNPGKSTFPTIFEAKAAVLVAEAERAKS